MDLKRSKVKVGRIKSSLLWINTQHSYLLCLSSSDDLMMFFFKMIQANLSFFIGGIRSDHGTEFENLKFAHYCDSHRVDHNFSAPRTPQQNSVVER